MRQQVCCLQLFTAIETHFHIRFVIFFPQLETTILQICHQKIVFHANGLFCINYAFMLQVKVSYVKE